MVTSNNTECGIVQMQIESLLDNELDTRQQHTMLEHVRVCPECARELLLARALRDAMLDMPQPQLPPELAALVLAQAELRPAPWRERLGALLPAQWPRLAIPAFAALAAVAVWLQLRGPVLDEPQPMISEQNVERATQQATQQPGQQLAEEYTREELVVAIRDLNTTIQTLNEITESMRVRVGDRVVSLPVLSLPVLSVDQTGGAAAPGPDDPI